jgi:hypothetical protein
MPSGMRRGTAATQVLNRSIRGFLSPVIISSGSLLTFWVFVIMRGRPYCVSRARRISTKTRLTCGKYALIPILRAVSSVNILLRNVFLTLRVFPLGNTPTDLGIGGSPSFCCKLSATTKNALNPMLILSGVKIILIGLPTESRSKTISLMAKSRRSCAMNWMIFTKMFKGVSLGTTPLEPLGNREFTMLCSLDCVAELLSHLMRIM